MGLPEQYMFQGKQLIQYRVVELQKMLKRFAIKSKNKKKAELIRLIYEYLLDQEKTDEVKSSDSTEKKRMEEISFSSLKDESSILVEEGEECVSESRDAVMQSDHSELEKKSLEDSKSGNNDVANLQNNSSLFLSTINSTDSLSNPSIPTLSINDDEIIIDKTESSQLVNVIKSTDDKNEETENISLQHTSEENETEFVSSQQKSEENENNSCQEKCEKIENNSPQQQSEETKNKSPQQQSEENISPQQKSKETENDLAEQKEQEIDMEPSSTDQIDENVLTIKENEIDISQSEIVETKEIPSESNEKIEEIKIGDNVMETKDKMDGEMSKEDDGKQLSKIVESSKTTKLVDGYRITVTELNEHKPLNVISRQSDLSIVEEEEEKEKELMDIRINRKRKWRNRDFIEEPLHSFKLPANTANQLIKSSPTITVSGLEDSFINITGKKLEKNEEITPQIDMVVAPPPPSSKDPTPFLYIRKLTRPFTKYGLINMLKNFGEIVPLVHHEEIWLDGIKSKCFVKYRNVENAIKARNSLHSSRWPLTNDKRLIVEFSSMEELKLIVLDERKSSKKDSSLDRLFGLHLGIDKPMFNSNESFELIQRTTTREEKIINDDKPSKSNESIEHDENEEKKIEENYEDEKKSLSNCEEKCEKSSEKEQKTKKIVLDNRFIPTNASPIIYWTQLTEDEIHKRKLKIEKETQLMKDRANNRAPRQKEFKNFRNRPRYSPKRYSHRHDPYPSRRNDYGRYRNRYRDYKDRYHYRHEDYGGRRPYRTHVADRRSPKHRPRSVSSSSSSSASSRSSSGSGSSSATDSYSSRSGSSSSNHSSIKNRKKKKLTTPSPPPKKNKTGASNVLWNY
ncbi:hypothetical protein SNEBB_004907 [Seison nebaliae]|nr:hypothetical protein SNEBB_004907 [Seison nebaliae]